MILGATWVIIRRMVSIESLISDEKVASILEAFDDGWVDAIVDLTIQIQQIPAPSFDEFERAQFVHTFFETIGLLDVSTDEIGNVYGRWQGTGDGLPLSLIHI